MSYISPNSKITICEGVPLDNSYGDTINFKSESAQRSYFSGLAKHTLTKQSYQRVGNGKMRVEICADDLYGCNYLYFSNDSFGSIVFYCFITGVEYINNITSEITYELDVMQTWHFYYDLGYCFVEREHVVDDSIGANVIEEPINFGAIRCRQVEGTDYADSYTAILATGYDSSGTPGDIYGTIPSGLKYLFADADSYSDLEDLWDFIQAAVDDEKDDAIVSIWLQLTDFTCYDDDIGDAVQVAYIDMPSTIDGYPPSNNKLFTYPYNYLCVDCGNDTAEYRYEWFNGFPDDEGCNAVFAMIGATCPNPEVICAPMGYNITTMGFNSTRDDINYTEAVTMRDFPQIGWATDAYRSWVANGGYYSTLFSVGAGAAGVVGGAVTKNPAMIASGAIGMASAIHGASVQANKGANGHGTQGGTALVNCRAKDFYFKKMQIQYDYAQMVDDYFTKYGYQVNKLKVPSRDGRPRWNYVKTQDCTILSNSVPADDVSKIESIYDNGITFWMSGSYVGSYRGDNSPD